MELKLVIVLKLYLTLNNIGYIYRFTWIFTYTLSFVVVSFYFLFYICFSVLYHRRMSQVNSVLTLLKIKDRVTIIFFSVLIVINLIVVYLNLFSIWFWYESFFFVSFCIVSYECGSLKNLTKLKRNRYHGDGFDVMMMNYLFATWTCGRKPK